MLLRNPTRRDGISLLEVLGATAIFLTALVAISQLMELSTDLAIDVRERSRATRLCQSKLNEFVAGVESLSGGASSGTFEEEEKFNWNAEIASESTAANLYRVTITVKRENLPGGPVEVSLTQYIFDPAQRGQLATSTASDSATTPSTTTTPTTGAGATGAAATGGGNTGGGNTGGGNTGPKR